MFKQRFMGITTTGRNNMGKSAQERKPNVVFILVDNVGWGDFGVYGGTMPTPRIDKLASEGIRFRTLQSIGAFCAHRCFSSPAA